MFRLNGFKLFCHRTIYCLVRQNQAHTNTRCRSMEIKYSRSEKKSRCFLYLSAEMKAMKPFMSGSEKNDSAIPCNNGLFIRRNQSRQPARILFLVLNWTMGLSFGLTWLGKTNLRDIKKKHFSFVPIWTRGYYFWLTIIERWIANQQKEAPTWWWNHKQSFTRKKRKET